MILMPGLRFPGHLKIIIFSRFRATRKVDFPNFAALVLDTEITPGADTSGRRLLLTHLWIKTLNGENKLLSFEHKRNKNRKVIHRSEILAVETSPAGASVLLYKHYTAYGKSFTSHN